MNERDEQDLVRLAESVRAGERRAVAKAITLVESERPSDRSSRERLLSELAKAGSPALRLGITGAPGVGKSTLIDALGLYAVSEGHRVGVLAIDPSSVKTGGSLLGDRTRMGRLGASPSAFVRPSPSGGASGGIGKRSREALLVLEAAGYDLLMLETVGVGQGELAVTDCVDVLLVLQMAGAGDDVQSLKRGVLEHADLVVFTKADGPRLDETRAARDALAALFAAFRSDSPSVLALSALSESDARELFRATLAKRDALLLSGELEERRRIQRRAWFRSALDEAFRERLAREQALTREQSELEAAVERGDILPPLAARRLIERL